MKHAVDDDDDDGLLLFVVPQTAATLLRSLSLAKHEVRAKIVNATRLPLATTTTALHTGMRQREIQRASTYTQQNHTLGIGTAPASEHTT